MQLLDTPPRSHTFWRALSLYHACRLDPIAQDVAHVQFRSRIAFKMVWCPPSFSSFNVMLSPPGPLMLPPPSCAAPSLSLDVENFSGRGPGEGAPRHRQVKCKVH